MFDERHVRLQNIFRLVSFPHKLWWQCWSFEASLFVQSLNISIDCLPLLVTFLKLLPFALKQNLNKVMRENIYRQCIEVTWIVHPKDLDVKMEFLFWAVHATERWPYQSWVYSKALEAQPQEPFRPIGNWDRYSHSIIREDLSGLSSTGHQGKGAPYLSLPCTLWDHGEVPLSLQRIKRIPHYFLPIPKPKVSRSFPK